MRLSATSTYLKLHVTAELFMTRHYAYWHFSNDKITKMPACHSRFIKWHPLSRLRYGLAHARKLKEILDRIIQRHFDIYLYGFTSYFYIYHSYVAIAFTPAYTTAAMGYVICLKLSRNDTTGAAMCYFSMNFIPRRLIDRPLIIYQEYRS